MGLAAQVAGHPDWRLATSSPSEHQQAVLATADLLSPFRQAAMRVLLLDSPDLADPLAPAASAR